MRYLRLILIPICGAWLASPPESESCGPWLPAAQFGYVNNPGPAFVKGELGVLSPKYDRRSLVVAYRYLSGAPLTAGEIHAISPKPASTEVIADSPAETWRHARAAVPGAPALGRIETIRQTLTEGRYGAYVNCLDGACPAAASNMSPS